MVVWVCGRTVNILTSRVLAVRRAAVVRASLSGFGSVGETGWIVSGTVGLSMGAQDGGKRYESEERQAGGRGEHGGHGEANGRRFTWRRERFYESGRLLSNGV